MPELFRPKITTKNIMNCLLSVLLLAGLTSQNQYCNSTGCFDCHYRCLACTGPLPSECTLCTQNYVLGNGTCFPCSQNCLSCLPTPSASTSIGTTCETCASGFYLSQSTNTCMSCPSGALSCTFSAVQQCQNGYYLLNSVCYLCISHCLTCSNAYACTQCLTGHYLTTLSTCSPCAIPNCSSCLSDGTCSLCASGFYGPNCSSLCPANCDICDSNACYQCSSSYLMTGSGCEAVSVLCAMGASYSSCYQCVGVAFLDSTGKCLPYRYVNGRNWQEYYTPLSNPSVFGSSLALQFCPGDNIFYYYRQNQTILSFNVTPNYGLKVTLQIATQQNTSALQVSSPELSQKYTLNVSNAVSAGKTCSSVVVVLNNFILTFTPNFTIPLSTFAVALTIKNLNGGTVGVSQMLVEEMPCGVTHCGLCLSVSTCQQCLSSFYLENNNCLSACSQGYYLTSSLSTCSLSCPSGFYPILANYLCQLCLPPCLTCSSQSDCLSCTQSTYLYAYNNSCLSTCPVGFYQSNVTNVCLPCRYPCKECSNGSQICMSCSLGYLSGTQCLMECPAMTYANVSALACHSCSVQCLTCALTPNACTSCPNASTLQPNSSCLPSCDPGRVSINGVCLKCSHPCSTCENSTTTCLSCAGGYLSNNTCSSLCQKGLYSDAALKICVKCPVNCAECTSATQCQSCSNSSFLYTANSSCLSQCPTSHYPSTATQNCVLCPQPCATCIDPNTCLSCQGSLFVLHNSACLLVCPVGSYLSLSPALVKACITCGANCTSCLSISQCLTCTNNTFLQNGLCRNSCSPGSFPLNSACLSCQFPCLECSSVDLCISCQPTYYLSPSTSSCLSTCPSSTYPSNSTCLSCNPLCSLCKDSSTLCLQCAHGYFKSSLTQECLAGCQLGYYGDYVGRSCRRCSGQCLGCLSGSVCTSCDANGGYPLLHLGNCLIACPSGYYVQINSVNTSNAINASKSQCVACSPQCSTCLNFSSTCTSCPLSLLYTSSLSTCTSTCPSSFYHNGAGVCLSCPASCLTCSSPSFCLSCTPQTNLFLAQCLSACPSGFFPSSSVCQQCSSTCMGCAGSASNCSSCYPGEYIMNGSCLPKCPLNYYQNSITLSCLSCVPPCLSCLTSSHCSSCVSSYLLFRDSCLLTCPSGYYSNSTHCMLCLAPCSTCSSSSVCLSCLSGYFLENITCLSTCPSNSYALQTSNGFMQCLACSSFCLECFDASACKSCYGNSTRPYLQGLQCLSNCTSGYYPVSSTFQCLSCGTNCVQCINNSICQQCSGAFLLQGTCTANCPLEYYSSLANTCQLCLSPCLTCYDAANCLTCLPSFFLYLTHCLPRCPPDTWTVTAPNICNSTCLEPYFTYSANKTCLPRCPFYHSPNRECLDVCSGGNMANASLGCQNCVIKWCWAGLEYQVIEQQIGGVLRVKIVFNQHIDHPELFSSNPQNSLSVVVETSEAPTSQQLDISALRSLEQITPASFSLVQISSQSVTIEPQLPIFSSWTAFSGTLHFTITNLSIFTANSYPLQTPNSSLTVQWYQPAPASTWSQYLAYLFSVILTLCFVINFILENSKVMVPVIDTVQTLHFIYYLQAWSHPALTHFMLGFRAVALRIGLMDGVGELWGCSAKLQQIYGKCSFYGELLFPGIVLLVLIGLNCLLSRINYYQAINRKSISWGLLYVYWWICSPSIALSALTYASSPSSPFFVPATIVSVCYGTLVLVLAFQIIKNVYNKSYAQRIFFWNLRKKAGQIANLHALLLMVRRFCLIIGLGTLSGSPLGTLFILTLLTVYIVSNWLINKPLRKMAGLQIGAEILMGVFILLLQMTIINATTLDNGIWNGLGYVMLCLAFGAVAMLSILTVSQTVVCVQKFIKKKREMSENKSRKDEEEDFDKERQRQRSGKDSNKDTILKASSQGLVSHKRKPSAPRVSHSTEQDFIRINSQTFSPKNKQLSEGFSDILEGPHVQSSFKPPSKLIKLSKQTSSQPLNKDDPRS